MSTTVNVRPGAPRSGLPGSSRRGWWLVPEIAAVAVLAILAVPFLGAGSSGLHDQIATRAAQIVEKSSPTAQHDHEDVAPVPQQVFCGVDVFGTDPPSPNALADVRTVYGYYFCASGSAGVPYTESNRADGPVVITLAGDGRAQIAQSGAGYADRVRAMMPDQYEDRCFHGLPDGSVAAAVRDRYESTLG